MTLQSGFPAHLRVGTSSWSSEDWVGPFYPVGTRPTDFLARYAERYDTVEIDSTWYHMPPAAVVDGWAAKTPEGFLFSAKVPKTITHDQGLVGCEQEMAEFVHRMDRLGDKLGPLLLQFEYVAKGKNAEEYRSGADFLARLAPFLGALPTGHRFVVEVRNEQWLRPELTDLLRQHGVALALTSYYTMPPVDRLLEKFDPAAAGFVYVRFLGHHRQMDATVKRLVAEGRRSSEWGELAVDREAELRRWVPVLSGLGKLPKYVYFNNHYAGHAPGSIKLFESLWRSAVG